MEDIALQRRLTSEGVEFYFPPLRDAGTALPLAVFGVLCVVLPLAAVYALVPPGVPVPYGLLVLALIGGLVAPFMLCGIAFVCLAFYMMSNSLRVCANPARLLVVRRLCGWAVSVRELPCAALAEIESEVPARFQNAFSRETIYRLIARTTQAAGDGTVLAESLHGKILMERCKRDMEAACGLAPASEGFRRPPQPTGTAAKS